MQSHVPCINTQEAFIFSPSYFFDENAVVNP